VTAAGVAKLVVGALEVALGAGGCVLVCGACARFGAWRCGAGEAKIGARCSGKSGRRGCHTATPPAPIVTTAAVVAAVVSLMPSTPPALFPAAAFPASVLAALSMA
jgi:hypothetical protein